MFLRRNLRRWTNLLVFVSSISIVYSLDVVINRVIKEDEIINDIEDTHEDSEKAVRPHYGLDPRQSRRLALLEETLYNSVSQILKNTKIFTYDSEPDFCNIHGSKYLLDYARDTSVVNGETGIARANRVTDNPILVLRMIRRIFVTLMNETRISCELIPEMGRTLDGAFNKADLTPPTQRDLNDALLGLLRIQYVYGLNATSQIRLGNLNGVDTGAFLYFDDCMALAEMAVEIGAEGMAYQWLRSARLSPHESEKSEEQLHKDTMNLEHVWRKLHKLTKFGNWKLLHKQLEHKRQEELTGYQSYHRYATCRGEVTMPIKYSSELFCCYISYWDTYFYINPVKAELLSEDPMIFQFYEFVGDNTINFVKEATTQMTRTDVYSSEPSKTGYNTVRTAMQTVIHDSENLHPPQELVRLNRRVEKLTGLEVMKEGASPGLLVALYGSLGGHFDIHTDSLRSHNAQPDAFGDKLATVLTFLSDTELGGYTAFPSVGVFAKPIKGSALLWYNLKLNGEPDLMTEHCGCPVILGTKHVSTRWILQYENMWKFPCSPNPSH